MVLFYHNTIIIPHFGVINRARWRNDVYSLITIIIGVVDESLKSGGDLGVEEVVFV
jgi:hypothetical protein